MKEIKKKLDRYNFKKNYPEEFKWIKNYHTRYGELPGGRLMARGFNLSENQERTCYNRISRFDELFNK